MNLALAVLFLWAGAMLLTIAFHPLTTPAASPSGVFAEAESKIQNKGSAYSL